MTLEKPESIRSSAYKSAKWDEIVSGRGFSERDVPAIALLCQWYAVVERCMTDLDFGGDTPQVAYQNDSGDLRAMPQLSTMKQASAEIRALNKQLGIVDGADRKQDQRAEVTPLAIIRGRYRGREANPDGEGRAV